VGLWRVFLGITHGLGRGRTLIRRVGGLCLLWMGVHAAANVLDGLAYGVLNALDLWLDESVAALLAWLASAGGTSAADAAARIESFAALVDLAEKDWLALRLALTLELTIDVLILDLAWGKRALDGGSLLGDVRESARQLRRSFSAVDLERVFAPLSLCAFAVAGAGLAGIAIEHLARQALERQAPDFLVRGNVAAFAALAAMGVLLWRFLPDMLHGALVRAHDRGEAFRHRLTERRAALTAAKAPRTAFVGPTVDGTRRLLRGWWWLVFAAVAAAGLVDGTLQALIERIGALP
jgi:hypothetical protein